MPWPASWRSGWRRGPPRPPAPSGVGAAPAPGRTAPRGAGTLEGLTPREREVALAVLDGLSNAEIADRLGIRLLTVKKHLSRVFEKAGVRSRTQLIRRLIGEGAG